MKKNLSFPKYPFKLILYSLLLLIAIVAIWQYTHISNKTQIRPSTMPPSQTSTTISTKPRDKIITYTVLPGDSLNAIAEKFTISVDTILWENNITKDTSIEGRELRILPVSGVSHTVIEGDTIESIAQKYNTTPKKITDYPFNEYANPETFSLKSGTVLIVPDGEK